MAPKKRAPAGDALAQQLEFISHLFSNGHLRKKHLSFVVDNLKVWTGCECVGIRVVDEDGVMPYDAFVGFDYDFWQAENRLCLTEHQCGCIRVATGQPDPLDLPLLTSNGSLCSNDLGAFFKRIPQAQSHRYRCKCLECGFASLVVIPIKRQGRVAGLIHLADRRKDMFPQDKILLLESVSGAIGEILAKYSSEDAVAKKNESMKALLAEIKERADSFRSTCSSVDQQALLADLDHKIEALQAQLP